MMGIPSGKAWEKSWENHEKNPLNQWMFQKKSGWRFRTCLFFQKYWEFHHPNSFFQRGGSSTKAAMDEDLMGQH